MLIPQHAESEVSSRHGRRKGTCAELRRQLAHPSKIDDGQRQRLLELSRRLRRVQALGDEYSRVELSEQATEALNPGAAVA